MPRQLVETVALSEAAAAQAASSGRALVEFITPGWGTSGFYSPEVIQEAATNVVIPKGTHMYADHPTEAENLERPIRSVKDLMGIVQEDAYVGDNGGLVGQVAVVPQWAPFLQTPGVAEAIGVSIRGNGTLVEGEAEGRKGPIVESIDAPLLSVDFVTRAGRGGKVLQLLEGAAAAHRAVVEHGITESTANDIRDALATTLRDAYGAEKTWVWVRDFDPKTSTVWFEIESDSSDGTNGIYAQSYADDGAALAGDKTEVRIQTSYVPAANTQESLPAPAGRNNNRPEEDTMPQIEEAQLRQLEEAAGQVPTLTTERDTAVRERDAAIAEARTLRNQTTARRLIGDVEGVRFSELEVRGLLAELPLTEAGELDETAFGTVLEEQVTAAREDHARSLQEAGHGRVSGFGTTIDHKGGELSESDLDATIAGVFGRQVKGA